MSVYQARARDISRRDGVDVQVHAADGRCVYAVSPDIAGPPLVTTMSNRLDDGKGPKP